MWVWDTLMRRVRGLYHNILMEYATGNLVAQKKGQKSGGNESFGWVCKGCAIGLFHNSSHVHHSRATIYVGTWLQSLVSPTEMPVVTIFPYACFGKKNLSSLRTKVVLHGQQATQQ